jgi:hypothetical protein
MGGAPRGIPCASIFDLWQLLAAGSFFPAPRSLARLLWVAVGAVTIMSPRPPLAASEASLKMA